MKNNRSPLLLSILAALVMTLLTAACGSDDPESSASDSGASDSGAAADEAADSDDAADDATSVDGDEVGNTDSVESDADSDGADSADADRTYPVIIDGASGPVTIVDQPRKIISLSPSATEILFAIGAGDQVAAVDQYSNYPAEAPTSDLDGFQPNFEAISTLEPDLVVVSGDADGVLSKAFALLDVPVLVQTAPTNFDEIYGQIADLGVATGQIDGAAQVNADLRSRIDAALAEASSAGGIRVYHELDNTYYSASSNTFIGAVYSRLGFENIADSADQDGFGYPQLTPEAIIEADPQLIVITDEVGYTVEDVAGRSGWDVITAVENGNVVQISGDVASRWGPRIAELVEQLATVASSTPASS